MKIENKAWKSKKLWLAAALTVVSVSILIKLGFWQLGRGEQKSTYELALLEREKVSAIALSDFIEMSELTEKPSSLLGEDELTQSKPLKHFEQLQALNGTRVKVEIEGGTGDVFLLDNQIHEGRVGYLVFMIGQLGEVGSGQSILLDLGFVEASRNRIVLPNLSDLSVPSNLSGRLYLKSTNPLSHELSAENTLPIRVQNLNIAELEDLFEVNLFPMVLQPIGLENWDYEPVWVPLPMSSSKHFGYAVQWFVMAAVLASIMLMISFRFWIKQHRIDSVESRK
ncbi:SURF1 family protein [Vibrio sp. 99-70-13A1]|uniref:SURF1 family protein n=1 Tax=Vibrio sp. 99-70-13A1 TaxID=2607601 RepID=UPI0020A40C64|nr:SURF1 family protein [Vibrio sp. 99-70-13A1]